jgi:hypothetical protein
MAIRDKVAMLISQLNPVMQATGANVAGSGANVLQQGANVLAGAGDAAFKRGGAIGNVQPPLSSTSNMLHAGSQNLLGMGPGGQAALGYGVNREQLPLLLAQLPLESPVARKAKKKRAPCRPKLRCATWRSNANCLLIN